MKKLESNLKNMVIVLTLIACISSLSLTWVNKITQTAIQASKDNAEISAIREVLPVDFDNNPFEEKTEIGEDNLELYPGRTDGKITSFAIKSFSNLGFGGRIDIIVGFYLDGTINTYHVVSHKETPGLGTKAWESPFIDQFQDFSLKKQNIDIKQDGGDIDAVTSATISSRAITDAIKRAYETFVKFNTGSNDE